MGMLLVAFVPVAGIAIMLAIAVMSAPPTLRSAILGKVFPGGHSHEEVSPGGKVPGTA